MPAHTKVPVHRLLAAVEQAYNCVAVSDTRGILEYVNPAFERMSGYSADEVIGSTFKPLQSGVHDQAFYDDLKATLASGQTWHGHFVNRKKDGSLYEEEATISPVRDESGTVTGYVAVKRDVTDERRLARELEEARAREVAFAAEREVLEQTVKGTVRALTEILSLMRPESFGRATRVAAYVNAVCASLGLEDWHLSMAAMLSQVGAVAIPDEIHKKAIVGLEMTDSERELYESHPQLAMRLLAGIPRLERVAALIGSLAPNTALAEEPPIVDPPGCLPFATCVDLLRAATVFDDGVHAESDRREVVATLRNLIPPVPEPVVKAFAQVPSVVDQVSERAVSLAELSPGMHLVSDIVSRKGMLLARGNQPITVTMLAHLRKIASAHGVREPLRVQMAEYGHVESA